MEPQEKQPNIFVVSAAAVAIGAGAVFCLTQAVSDRSVAPSSEDAARHALPTTLAELLDPKVRTDMVGADLKSVVGIGEAAYVSRREAFARFEDQDRDLLSDELAVLTQVILGKHREGLSDGQWHALANDSLSVVLGSEIEDPLKYALVDELFTNPPEGDPVIKDYAIQHMSILAENLADAGLRERIAETIRGAAGEAAEPWSGTALLAMGRLSDSQGDSTVARERFEQLAIRLAVDEGTCLPARITAIQTCAEHGMGGDTVIEMSGRLAGSAEAPVSLRMSAVSAIGKLGGAAERELLQRLRGTRDSRVRFAISIALENITKRLRKESKTS